MTFRFRLATLQKLREQVRDERRRELAKAFEAERILRDQLTELQSELAENQSLLRGMSSRPDLPVDDLSNARRYESILKAQVLQRRTQLVQVEQETERRRLALLEADRDVKALDKLSERQLAQFNAAMEKSEQKDIDEAALRGFRTNREVHT